MKLDPAQQDRACGTILGTAIGDALGAPYEFGCARLGPDGPRMIGGGLGGFAPGEWTDDTTLRLAFALPPGSYATALLQELGEIVDSSKRHNRSSENSAGHWQAPAAGV